MHPDQRDDVGPWGDPRGTEGLPISSPAPPGLSRSRRGLWRGSGHVGDSSSDREPHEEPAHGNSWPKALSQTLTSLSMKGWTFLQALPIPFRAITLWFQRESTKGCSEHCKGNLGKLLIWDVWSSISLICPGSGGSVLRVRAADPSYAWLTLCHPLSHGTAVTRDRTLLHQGVSVNYCLWKPRQEPQPLEWLCSLSSSLPQSFFFSRTAHSSAINRTLLTSSVSCECI